MKKVVALIVSILFILSVTGLSFAVEEKKPVTPAVEEKKPAAPAEKKAVKKSSTKQVTGEVVAVDAIAMTLTVKGKKGEVALSADDKTAVKMGKEKKALADVKVGDKVKVKYTVKDGKNVAKSIAPVTAPAKKHAKPAEAKPAEAKPAEAKPAEAKPAEAKPAEKK
jgi:surface antigen